MLFFSCGDSYKRVGDEALPKIFPQGIAQNSELTYTEALQSMENEDKDTVRVISVIKAPVYEIFDNLEFPYQTFPEGLVVDIFDEHNNKNVVKADYGIMYSATELIDLQGNVVLETHDGKMLETPQLFYDQTSEWIFTENKFTYTNPEEGTVMDGEGMDFNKDFSYLNAHKTFGLMAIKENVDD